MASSSHRRDCGRVIASLFFLSTISCGGPEQPSEGIAPVSPRSVAAFDLGKEPFHRQGDERWGSDRIGGSNETLRGVGCTISCVSMGLAVHGIETDPGALNRWLVANEGYTERGWVKWDSVELFTERAVRVVIPSEPSHERIERALEEGNPVITKIRLWSGVQHWVLIVGRDGTEYLIKDPLTRSVGLSELSDFDSNVFSIRILEKR
ncbi:MAG: C39 family peptidase [Acidobacteriota bacterium]